jgi:hypothetical protein
MLGLKWFVVSECLGRSALFRSGSVGPEWIHTSRNNVVTDSVGGEVAIDFMYWLKGKHKFGWYVEPTYEHDFGRGHEQSLGASAGLLVAIP